jgi:peptidylprolyl isomerase
MSKKQDYKNNNLIYFEEKSKEEAIHRLPEGILYRVIRKGTGTKSPNIRSVVCVQYRGMLINGKEFDSSFNLRCAPAFRVSDLIVGWQIALSHMHIGDVWEITIPPHLGYGSMACGEIPGNSTLIFELELLSIS